MGFCIADNMLRIPIIPLGGIQRYVYFMHSVYSMLESLGRGFSKIVLSSDDETVHSVKSLGVVTCWSFHWNYNHHNSKCDIDKFSSNNE